MGNFRKSMKKVFCNKCNLSEKIPQLIAEEVLGIDNLSLLKERYQQIFCLHA
jgi:hypothetical protein